MHTRGDTCLPTLSPFLVASAVAATAAAVTPMDDSTVPSRVARSGTAEGATPGVPVLAAGRVLRLLAPVYLRIVSLWIYTRVHSHRER